MPQVLHGIQLETKIFDHQGVFKFLPESIKTGHYHSWVLDEVDFPECLKVTAYNAEGGIMAFEHTEFDIIGLQFHPESVLTPLGDTTIRNWLQQ